MLIRKNDSGRSIVEMLGVLAIMGVITVMGISGYSQAVGKINRNKIIEDFENAVINITFTPIFSKNGKEDNNKDIIGNNDINTSLNIGIISCI